MVAKLNYVEITSTDLANKLFVNTTSMKNLSASKQSQQLQKYERLINQQFEAESIPTPKSSERLIVLTAVPKI